MGAKYRYKCRQCGYSPLVGGGPDIGFAVKVQTGFCRTCHELVDYATEVWSPNGVTEKEVIIGACPRCGAKVEQFWNHGDACPKCGGEFGKPEFELQWI